MFACLKLNLNINDVIEYGPKPPISFEGMEEKEVDRILKKVAEKKQSSQK